VFTTTGEKPTATSVLLQGTSSPAAGVVYGQGVRCVGGTLKRLFTKTASGGSITLFAFDSGQGLSEHTSPFDAHVLVLEGSLTLTIGGTAVRAMPGTIVRMPADIPHSLDAPEACRMLLIMLRDLKGLDTT